MGQGTQLLKFSICRIKFSRSLFVNDVLFCFVFVVGVSMCSPTELIDDDRFFGVAKRFNDHGDGSIDEINLLLGSSWR